MNGTTEQGALPGEPPEEHVLDESGEFHVVDAPIDLSAYRFEDWVALGIFWSLALTVFYQFFTRYALNDSAAWTEEIARYLLIGVTFVGGAMAVRKDTHIHVDYFYRFMPRLLARAMSTLVDIVRALFLGYAVWLTYQLIERIGHSSMSVVDLPMGIVYGVVMFGFFMMFVRAVQIAAKNWKRGYSVLERPEIALEGEA